MVTGHYQVQILIFMLLLIKFLFKFKKYTILKKYIHLSYFILYLKSRSSVIHFLKANFRIKG